MLLFLIKDGLRYLDPAVGAAGRRAPGKLYKFRCVYPVGFFSTKTPENFFTQVTFGSTIGTLVREILYSAVDIFWSFVQLIV